MSAPTPNASLALGVVMGGLLDPKIGMYKFHSLNVEESTAVVESTSGTLLQVRVKELPPR